MVRVKAASIYVGGTKVGQFEGAKYDIQSGDEPQFGDPGFLGYSDGATTTHLTATGIVPTTPMDFDFVKAIQSKADLDIYVMFINGAVHNSQMRCVSSSFSSSHKSGTLTGEFTFGGGPPKLV